MKKMKYSLLLTAIMFLVTGCGKKEVEEVEKADDITVETQEESTSTGSSLGIIAVFIMALIFAVCISLLGFVVLKYTIKNINIYFVIFFLHIFYKLFHLFSFRNISWILTHIIFFSKFTCTLNKI